MFPQWHLPYPIDHEATAPLRPPLAVDGIKAKADAKTEAEAEAVAEADAEADLRPGDDLW